MRGVVPGLGRCAPGDHTLDDDHRRLAGLGLERLQRRGQCVEVVGVVDVLHRPAVALEPLRDVLGERQLGAALDGDLVAVVDPAQVGQLEMTGQRRRLGADPLHQAAVAADRVDVVVEQRVVGLVEGRRLPLAGDGHAHAGRDAGAERARGALHSGRPPVLRVPGALGVQLPELLQVLQRHRQLTQCLVDRVDRLDPGQMEHRVEQGRRVPGGQHEPVAVAPDRLVRVEAQEALPHRVHHRRQGHRRAGVAGVGGLHGIHAQGADGVDGNLLDRLLGEGGEVLGRGVGHETTIVPRGAPRQDHGQRSPSFGPPAGPRIPIE